MPGTLGVWLNATRVGALTNILGDYTIFAFADEYREDPLRPVLSQGLVDSTSEPLRRIPRTHTIAPPFFSNLLPEVGSLLRDLLARQHGLPPTADFGFLRALGGDLPGAVRLLDEETQPEHSVAHDGRPLAEPETPLRFSLAGAQLKFSATMRGNRLTIPAEGGSWIVKLPTNTYPHLPENEHAMMRFAHELGFNVPELRLIELEDIENLPLGLPALRREEPHVAFAIARFDRLPQGGRVHFEDFNQIAGQSPAEKYDKRSMSYVASVVSQLCPVEDMEELIARMIFGIAIGNGDMHLKNWAVIYPDGRTARLAPLYDYVCTKRYYPEERLALPLGSEREYRALTLDTLKDFAAHAELSQRMVARVTAETVARIRDTWSTFKATVSDETLVQTIDDHMNATPLL